MNLMKTSEILYCEADNGFHLVNGNSKNNVKALVNSNDTSSSSGNYSSLILLSTDNRMDSYEQIVTLEQCSNAYFAGYLDKKCVDKLV